MSPTTEGVSFTFEGRRLEARRGQSIAAALMASGTSVLTRSFKYRRPRGYTCGYGVCGNCPVTVDGLPGVSACTTTVQGGETVRRERGWPSTDHDVLRGADVIARFLPAGFQFRMFRRRPRLAHLAEKVMAHIAGAGRFPTRRAAASPRTWTSTARPDVLVVGGGLSGCAAALGAATSGASVLLVHRGDLGGRALGRPGREKEIAAGLAAEAVAHGNIEVVDGLALSWFEGGTVPVLSGPRLIEVHPRHLVVATGSYDVPGLFPGNDKPGVVLADGVSRMLTVERVVPWRRAVVLTDSERGHALARQLAQAGVHVLAVVQREGPWPGCGSADGARDPGEANGGGRHITGRIRAARGLRTLRRVDVEATDGTTHRLSADLLCVALRERPADELALQWRYVAAGTPEAAPGGWSAPSSSRAEGLTVVGSAAGWAEPDRERAYRAGLAAATGRTDD